MRVAFVTWKFPCVSNTFILYEITELLKRGHEVLILSIDSADEDVVHAAVTEYGLLENTYFLEEHIPWSYRHPVLFRLLRRVGAFSDSGVRRYAIDDLRERIHALKPLSKIVSRHGVDVIHAAFGSNSATVALLLSRLTGVPFTFESHALDLFVSFRFAEEKLNAAAKVFTISEYNKRYIIQQYKCPESKIVVKRVPFSRDDCDKLCHLSKDDNLIVSVARLHPIKGLEHAIDAFHILRRRRQDLRYFIVGDGEARQALRKKVASLGLEESIRFTGSIPNHEALRYQRKAAITLLPSVIAEDGDRDGIPTSLVEAMYLETPAISTHVSGIPELIEDGVNGYLVAPGDPSALALKAQLLLSDLKLRREMGIKARASVVREFDIDRNIRKLTDTWERITHQRGVVTLPQSEPEPDRICK